MSEQQSVAGVSSPLDAILGSGGQEFHHSSDPPSQESAAPEVVPQEPDDPEGPQVSLLALHRERERRQKMDARVKELEQEIEKYNEQKWGLEPQPDKPDENQQNEQRAFAYNQSFANFVAKHGREKVAAIDAAVNAMPQQQKDHVFALLNGDGDPVERIAQYVDQLGLVKAPDVFRQTSLQDALTGKKQLPAEPAADPLAGLDQREQAIFAAERNTTFNASRADFVSEFGKAQFDTLDAAAKQFMESGHPASAEFAAAVKGNANPIAAAAQMLSRLGVWSPQAAAPAPRPPPVMPSNFVAARSVAARSGPAFGGPTPLADIFKR